MSSRERRDPYIVLGVARHASGEDIARAYRRAARASHPDSGGAGSGERFRVVSDAYDQLRDPRRRAMYDQSHPIAQSPTADSPGGSVRYAAPGSQHVVLGRPAPPAALHRRLPFDEIEGRSAPRRGDIGYLVQIAFSLFRGGW
jgi:curved DNA-binding protein CbpA